MKRTKLSLKSESVRVLSNVELHSVGGGVLASGLQCNIGGGSGSENSVSIGGCLSYYTGGCAGWVYVNGQYQYFG